MVVLIFHSIIFMKVSYVSKGGERGDDPPSLRSPTLDPSLGLKNCPSPLRVKKVGLYPLNILSIPTLDPP